MNQRYDVLGFGLIVLGGAILAALGTTDVMFTDQSWLYRYQGLIGAFGTVFAGWLAFYAVQRQIAHTEEQLLKSQAAAKLAAKLALSQPVLAAGSTLNVIRQASTVTDDEIEDATRESNKEFLMLVGRLDQMVAGSIAQLAATLEHFSLRDIVKDLDSNSRSDYLMALLQLSSFVTVATKPAAENSRSHWLALHIQALEGVHNHISRFDADLGSQYAEDGGIALANPETRAGDGAINPRGATSRSRGSSRISCASATCLSAVSASGASVKSTNFAGVAVIMETRHRTRRSRGLVFLAFAIYLVPAVAAGNAVMPGAGDLAINSSQAKSRATPKKRNAVARLRMSVGSFTPRP
jgi:hypothetical protein